MTGLTSAVKFNNTKRALKALRVEIWDAIFSTTSGKDIAALSKRWMEVSNELGDKDRDSYQKLRNYIAATIEGSESGRDIAALSIRLLEVLRELEAMPDKNARRNPAQVAREALLGNAPQG
jgi:hypothetical protein